MNGSEMTKTKNMICIVKVGGTPLGGGSFKKWHVNNLVKFTSFLDKNYPEWRYFNVYDKKSKRQIGNFTKSNRP